MTLTKNPSGPGEMLVQPYLEPLGMSATVLAKRFWFQLVAASRFRPERAKPRVNAALDSVELGCVVNLRIEAARRRWRTVLDDDQSKNVEVRGASMSLRLSARHF